jgi:ethanolamine utilization protein EutQ (cupin superfamily)
MPELIEKPVFFQDAAVCGEEIKEWVGRISTGTDELSIGLLSFPEGWSEPPQCPEFDEYTVVLEGNLYVDTESAGTLVIRAGSGILTPRGERIQYRTPEPNGAKYLAVCFPAFSPELTHRSQAGVELPKTPQPNWTPQCRITLCRRPTYFQGTGLVSKQVAAYFGYWNHNSQTAGIVQVRSYQGYEEEFRCIDYDNYYLVLKGELHFQTEPSGEWIKAVTDQAISVRRGESLRCAAPTPDGAEYIIVSHPPWDQEWNRSEFLNSNNRIIVTDEGS